MFSDRQIAASLPLGSMRPSNKSLMVMKVPERRRAVVPLVQAEWWDTSKCSVWREILFFNLEGAEAGIVAFGYWYGGNLIIIAIM